ncbi:AAA domain-containing protein [Burkholderia sp. Ax-1719]|uniref:DEAD/DEAH box helicase n=1 Tax=Burkholderia sp. Ax-1719 TaxID=2608334 RepID=UPI001424614A|nr:AAA domain-containing protein [Burkholderia sp. Ax-1719]
MQEAFRKAQILQYWRAIEIFNPQTAPKIDLGFEDKKKDKKRKEEQTDSFALPSDAAPWQREYKRLRAPSENRVWRHEVYGGIYAVKRVRDLLEAKFGSDPQSFDSRLDAVSACFYLRVDADGRPLFNTFVISSCVWAWGRTMSPGPDSTEWLAGFELFADALLVRVRQLLAICEDDEVGRKLIENEIDVGRKLTLSDISALTELILTEVGLASETPQEVARVTSTLVNEKYQHEDSGSDFLNSFLAKDLSRVANAIEGNEISRPLAAYLTPEEHIDEANRLDVREATSAIYESLKPSRFPVGRWPSKGHHPLVFGQQFAINSITEVLGQSGGLFSVNGPPGTGKTTLLRDLVAHVVVERAMCLSRLAQPEDAFGTATIWKSADGYRRTVRHWKPEFAGFEIVVASANNGAVENITLELPGADAIDDDWKAQIDYFPDLAARAIEDDKPVWGLVAARLGNMGNRASFIRNVWWDKDPNRNTPRADQSEDDKPLPGLKSWLIEAQGKFVDWSSAKNAFRGAVAKEKRLRTEREAWSRLRDRLTSAQSEYLSLAAALLERQQASTKASSSLAKAESARALASIRHTQAKDKKSDFALAKPGFFETLLTFGRAHKNWRLSYLQLVNAEQDAAFAMEQAAQTEAQLVEIKQAALRFEAEAMKACTETKQHVSVLDGQIAQARAALREHFVEESTLSQSDEVRECSSPWADRAWNDARAEVFLEALKLHKAFVAANAAIVEKNLFAAVDILNGKVPPTIPRDATKAAWQTLFTVVPVVSSTFASYDRLFAHLGSEDIGWLLIDEAGQGIPQAAVGALWRAQRAVIVGDPLQLEPILPLPFTAQQSLRSRFNVAETWLPGQQSIQRLADRVSKVGTYLPDHEGNPLWVSSPLRVHRRCDFDMFNVSNKIAYHGLMVFGVVGRKEIELPDTGWIHVNGSDADDHWIKEEGLVVDAILADVHDHEHAGKPIYVISPFRDVTRNLRKHLKGRYPNVRVGTIHTVQGKESDVVLLVLGGNPNRPGAKQWASEKPNLLNVAVSRAKRRLYVIGNREAWKTYEYFSKCSIILKHHPVWPGLAKPIVDGVTAEV